MNVEPMVTIPLLEYSFLLDMKLRNDNNMVQHNEVMHRINNLEQTIVNMINMKK